MDTTTMTREDFETWLEENVEAALDQCSQTPRSLDGWVASFCVKIRRAADESATGENIDDAFGGDLDDDQFGGAGD